MKTTNTRGVVALACFALVQATVSVALAQTMAVPPASQPAVFDKIFGYDRTLGDRAALQVLIVRGAADQPALAELEAGFRQLGIPVERVPASAVAARLGPGVVVYLTDETATPAMLEQIARAHALSVSGDPLLAERGRASVALGDSGGKPEIVVNLDRVGTEGHDFSAQMLKVSRVVRGGGSATPAAGFQAPVLAGFDRPEYPVVARRMRVQGDVVLRLQVDAAGAVTGVELVKGVGGTAGLDETAMRAARTAKFRPAMRDGKAVPSVYTLTVPFRL
jgi:TonB family protein